MPNITFIHHANNTNIGDLLCSPKHYFDFESADDLVVVGGGASNNFFCGRAREQPARVRIVWGVGQSWRFDQKRWATDAMIKSALRCWTYDVQSTRDPELSSRSLPLVPCVSVFHPVTELPLGTETGVFLNASDSVSGCIETKDIGIVATNDISGAELPRFFGRTRTIITNSYHGAYWGLLSGRSVHIIGYSSKFTSLAALFGFPESSVLRVVKGDGDALRMAITSCRDRDPLRLHRAEAVRDEFRTINCNFARSLSGVGVRASLKN